MQLDGSLQQRVARNLERFPRQRAERDGLRHAAVALVLLSDDAGRACFVLTRRAAGLRAHSGQWALPGGSLDPGEDAEQAARRELLEEVGLALDEDAVLGRLDDYVTRSGFAITPVVAWAGEHPALDPDPAEVAEVHRVPLAELLRPDVPQLRRIPESERPVISVPLQGTCIHAPTAALLFQLREVALCGRTTRVAHFEQPVFAWS